jgi:hypothetical protein
MTKLANYKHNIKVEILTPLSVGGSGEDNWKQGVDYIIKGNKLYHLSLKKMIEYCIKSEAIANIYANQQPITSLIAPNELENICDKVYPCSVSSATDVRNMIRNQLSGKPIIPGSSFKGAIRSALLHQMYKSDPKNPMKESAYFGELKYGENFMRYVKVSDIEFPDTQLVNTKIYNLRKENNEWEGGWKHGGSRGTNEYFDSVGFNTLYECLTPNMSSIGSIAISNGDTFRHGVNTQLKQSILSANGIFELFKQINQSTKDYLNSEKDFFKTYGDAEGSEEIINSIDALIDRIPDDNSYCILKMSAGCGFHSITGNWQYEDYTTIGEWGPRETKNKNLWNKHKYKSRKIADYNDNLTLMGFVKISLA